MIGRLARNLGLLTEEKLAVITLAKNTSLIGMHKLMEYRICRPNGVGGTDLMPEGAIVEGVGASGSGGASSSQAGPSQAQEEEIPRTRPMMTTMDRFVAIEGRLGHIDTEVMGVRSYMDDLATGVFGMSDQFDGFQADMRRMHDEQQRFYQWNANRVSEMMTSMHLSHDRWTGAPYVYVPDVPDLGV